MTDNQMPDGSTNRLEQKIDTLTDTVGQMHTRFGRVEQELGGVKLEVGRVETRLGSVEHELQALGKQVTKVHVLAEKTEQFTKDVWDSLESLRTNVAKGFEEAKKERNEGFQLVHSAIRHLSEKVQRIEEAPARARNREL